MHELDRFVLMRLLERCALVLLLVFGVLVAAGYALAATPMPRAQDNALETMGPAGPAIAARLLARPPVSPAIPANPGLPR